MKKIISLVVITLMLCSCSTRYYNNSSHATHDTVYVVNTELRVDSVWRDRIKTVEVKGDSVCIVDSIIVEKWRLRTLIDTLWKTSYNTLIDSVYVETPSVKHERSKYDIFTSYGFWILILLDLIAFVLFIMYVFYKSQK